MHSIRDTLTNVKKENCQGVVFYLNSCNYFIVNRICSKSNFNEKERREYEIHFQIYHEGNLGKFVTEIRRTL